MNYLLRLFVVFGLGYEVEAALLNCAVVRKPNCAEMDSSGYKIAGQTTAAAGLIAFSTNTKSFLHY